MHQILHGWRKQTVLPHPFTVVPGNISGALQQGGQHPLAPLLQISALQRIGHDPAIGPVLHQFMAAHRIPEVTVVADAGMLSDGNLKALAGAGLAQSAARPDI